MILATTLTVLTVARPSNITRYHTRALPVEAFEGDKEQVASSFEALVCTRLGVGFRGKSVARKVQMFSTREIVRIHHTPTLLVEPPRLVEYLDRPSRLFDNDNTVLVVGFTAWEDAAEDPEVLDVALLHPMLMVGKSREALRKHLMRRLLATLDTPDSPDLRQITSNAEVEELGLGGGEGIWLKGPNPMAALPGRLYTVAPFPG